MAASGLVDAVVFRHSDRRLWRGKALGGTTGRAADTAQPEGLRVAAVACLSAAGLGVGHHAHVVPDLYKHVTTLPCHEPRRSLLTRGIR